MKSIFTRGKKRARHRNNLSRVYLFRSSWKRQNIWWIWRDVEPFLYRLLSSGDPRLGIPPALFFSTLPRQPAPRLRPSIKSAFDSKRSTAITVKSISQECNEPRKDRADIFRSRIIHTRVKGIIALKLPPLSNFPFLFDVFRFDLSYPLINKGR